MLISSFPVKITSIREMTSCGEKVWPINPLEAGAPRSTGIDESDEGLGEGPSRVLPASVASAETGGELLTEMRVLSPGTSSSVFSVSSSSLSTAGSKSSSSEGRVLPKPAVLRGSRVIEVFLVLLVPFAMVRAFLALLVPFAMVCCEALIELGYLMGSEETAPRTRR